MCLCSYFQNLGLNLYFHNCYLWMANQWMHQENFRERIIQINPLGLPNDSDRIVERPQRLWTPECTPAVSLYPFLSLSMHPYSSTDWSVQYPQCPHSFFPPPWLPLAVGFLLEWNIQCILLWWTTLGASFSLVTELPEYSIIVSNTWFSPVVPSKQKTTFLLLHISSTIEHPTDPPSYRYDLFCLVYQRNTIPPQVVLILKYSLGCNHHVRDAMIPSFLPEHV